MLFKNLKKMIQATVITSTAVSFLLLTGCASQSLKAPCPDYGKSCSKTPVNSWDTSVV
jgi:multisubunit Na+/H+ antiporter MnhC subunit